MGDRLSFSHQEQSLEEIATYHASVQAGLFDFFAKNSQQLIDLYTGTKISDARNNCVRELDRTSSLTVLSSVEASIRLDYLVRVYGRWRDPLSKAMKLLHRNRGNRARLEEDLISLWRNKTSVGKELLQALNGAFNYRHWLAHGRYWTPKVGRRYDYPTVHDISQEFIDAMESFNLECDSGRV